MVCECFINYLSFNIDLIGVCDEKLEADRDTTYDESTDPNAAAYTKSQTTEIESSTLALSQFDIETELLFKMPIKRYLLAIPFGQ